VRALGRVSKAMQDKEFSALNNASMGLDIYSKHFQIQAGLSKCSLAAKIKLNSFTHGRIQKG